MLLYAGNASLNSFEYSIYFFYIVKKSKQWSQSAGNTLSGTSETIRNNTYNNISVHVPRHVRPLNDVCLGYYLAGLIDGNGYFTLTRANSALQLIIEFDNNDVKLAYLLKSMIGFGKVKKVKDKNGYIYVIDNKDGISKVLHLINGKLRLYDKYIKVINISQYLDLNINFEMDTSNNLDNYWFAGFSDALDNACFQININDLNNKLNPEIGLAFQIDHKINDILLLIKNWFRGNIGYYKTQDTYYYHSTSFGSNKNITNYFDKYHLQSSKYINYLKWRKAYVIIQDKKHITEKGIDKIKKLKVSMIRNEV